MSSDPAETILLTIFLKHDQSKNLEGIQGHLAASGRWERFTPKGELIQLLLTSPGERL